jgi:hypothetical protein
LNNKCNSNELVFNTTENFIEKNNFNKTYINNSSLVNNQVEENEENTNKTININISTGSPSNNQSMK